jgi:hypothetical protein
MRISLAVIAVGIAVGAHAETERHSFLETPAPTRNALISEVRSNSIVMDRYMRHFSMTRTEVVNYFSLLHLGKLPKEGVYAVYNVPKDGSLHMRYIRLKKGTKVWMDVGNAPILKESCGNPLTRGPNRRADEEAKLWDAEADLKETIDDTDQLIAKTKPFEPPVPLIDQTPTVPTETPQVVTTGEPPMTFTSRKGIPPFIVLIPPILIHLIPPPRHNSPPPVPEPASFLALAIGAGGILARSVRRRERKRAASESLQNTENT